MREEGKEQPDPVARASGPATQMPEKKVCTGQSKVQMETGRAGKRGKRNVDKDWRHGDGDGGKRGKKGREDGIHWQWKRKSITHK